MTDLPEYLDPTLKDLLEMDLHDLIAINCYFAVVRVPGGWLYNLVGESEEHTSTFVPEPKEKVDFSIYPESILTPSMREYIEKWGRVKEDES